MNNKYPRIGTLQPRRHNTSAKCRCGAVGSYKVAVQTSWFRGDDKIVWSCDDHCTDVKYLMGVDDE